MKETSATMKSTEGAAMRFVLAALVVSACNSQPTQLVVLVDSDLSVPSELTAVRAIIRGQDNAELTRHEFKLAKTFENKSQNEFVLPISFAVLPPNDDTNELLVIDIEAIGSSATPDPLFTRRAITGFVQGTSLWLPMYLFRNCLNIQCPEGLTCTENGCTSPRIDETKLGQADKNGENKFDWPDASIRDAKTPDSSSDEDSGVPDDTGFSMDADSIPDTLEKEDTGPNIDSGTADAGHTPCAWPTAQGGCDEAIQVVAGAGHTCALRQSGAVVCWGKNNRGQLGTWTQLFSSTPQEVYSISNAIKITAGGAHTCALLADQSVQCWGTNNQGQLGNGMETDYSSRPRSVIRLDQAVVDLGAGQNHTCAVLQNGQIQCWGANSYGELGDGTNTLSRTPVAVNTIGSAADISVGYAHSCARLTTGQVHCWGQNEFGQLGDGTENNRNTPVPASGISSVLEVSSGDRHTCVRTSTLSSGTTSSSVYCWGSNEYYVVGPNAVTENQTTAVRIPGLESAREIASGWHTTCARLESGNVHCWGNNREGTLGNGTTTSSSALSQVLGLTNTSSIAVGGGHACAILENKDVSCWGMNTGGQLGNDVRIYSTVPVPVTGLSDAASVHAGYRFTCVRRTNGNMQCVGSNEWGKLGDSCSGQPCYLAFRSTLANTNVPNSLSLDVGSYHACAILPPDQQDPQSVYCWGRNSSGEQGNGTVGGFVDSPQRLENLSGEPVAISASTLYHTCALVKENAGTDVQVYCWGEIPQLMQSSLPVIHSGFSLDGLEIVSGNEHTCIRTSRGTVECVGTNTYGQLGDGTVASSTTPVSPQGLTNVAQISAGNHHTCIRKADGTAMCWGRNYSGQLGEGTTVDAPRPVSVQVTGLAEIAAGGYSTCGRKISGEVWCWGSSNYGQLGTGVRTTTAAPSLVHGLTDAEALSLGNNHTCARRTSGEVMCWGKNESGELGDGRFFRRLSPQLVTPP